MYRPIVVIETTAKNAHGTPAAFPARTENAGTRRLSTALHRRQPGIARSRENAYQVRDALVRPAMPQKIWPIVEMRITSSAQPELIALVKTEIDVPPASLIAFVSEAANVIASRTSQPN